MIFAGVLTEMSIKVENQLRLLSATVRSGSYLMDLNPHIRSFQALIIEADTLAQNIHLAGLIAVIGHIHFGLALNAIALVIEIGSDIL